MLFSFSVRVCAKMGMASRSRLRAPAAPAAMVKSSVTPKGRRREVPIDSASFIANLLFGVPGVSAFGDTLPNRRPEHITTCGVFFLPRKEGHEVPLLR